MSVETALYGLLSSDEELAGLLAEPTSVFEYFAPADKDPPYLIFGLHVGNEIWSFRNFYREQIWFVKGVTRGPDATPAKAIDTRCEELLNDAALDIGERLMYLRRRQDISFSEEDGGTLVSQRGGLYDLLSEPEGP